jgi:hypothetical protein
MTNAGFAGKKACLSGHVKAKDGASYYHENENQNSDATRPPYYLWS